MLTQTDLQLMQTFMFLLRVIMEILHRRSNNSAIIEKIPMARQLHLLLPGKQKIKAILILYVHFCETYLSNVSNNLL